MSIAVIVSTYNAPRELELVLCALTRQTVLPDEILIADDGSGGETRRLIDRWRERFQVPLLHSWQRDAGYRKARIVNEAIRRSRGARLLFLDGDSFPHRRWVEDHLEVDDPGLVACGRRVKLGPELSRDVSIDDIMAGRFDRPGTQLLSSAIRGDTRRLGLGVRLPRSVARVLHPRPRRLMGVNYSLSREAFYAVNGLDEEWAFYGREDLDLELRLQRARYRFYPLINRAIVYHLHHTERERSPEALALVERQREASHVRCDRGVESSESFDPQA